MAKRPALAMVAKAGSAFAVAFLVAGAAAASAPLEETKPGGATGGSRPLFLEPPPPPALADLLTAPSPALPNLGPSGFAGRGALGIPASVLKSYQQATTSMGKQDPSCAMPISLLAAIGRVESNHARGGALDRDGTALSPIVGPRLDGSAGTARIRDTDKGFYDFDRDFDRAVGSMQFIPGTWRNWSADANDDGERNPQNVFDASLTAARYLCAGDRSMSDPDGLRQAILSYNNSEEYLQTVLAWMDVYARGASSIPNGSGIGAPAPQPTPTPTPTPTPSQSSSPKSSPSQPPKAEPKPPERQAAEEMAKPMCQGAEAHEDWADAFGVQSPFEPWYDPYRDEYCPTPTPSPSPTTTSQSGDPLGGVLQ